MKLKIILICIFFLVPTAVQAIETCPAGEVRYREGGDCEKESPLIHSKITDYPITCQDTPSVTYHRESRTPPPNPNKAIVKVNSDISQAELGGFGPSLEAIGSKSPDTLASLYPFNALFDKPPNTSPFNERESFRTYWRLLSFLQQANAKAFFLQEVNNNHLNNQTFKFYNKQDIEKEWTVKDLFNKLPGCLKDYPVCDDFLKKYLSLNIDTQEAYDALMPFNFDNIRGYEVIKYNAPTGGTVTHIMAENLPYIAAINQGLLDTQTGLLNTLSPSWLNPARQNNLTSNSTIDQTQELSLVPKIKNYAQVMKCKNPEGEDLYLPAPLTFPTGLDNPDNTLEQTFEIPISTHTEIKRDSLGIPYLAFISDGTGEGTTSVLILNNPKQKDISLGLAEDTTSSLFHMFTTSASQEPYQDKDLDAPISNRTGEPVNPKSGEVSVTEPGTDIERKGGQPHVKLCELRNKWFIPASLQRVVSCEILEYSIPSITPAPLACPAKQHLFENTCGQVCYQTVLDKTLSTSSCNGQVLNPYFTIAIALDKNGGLVSSQPQGTSLKHFGCDPNGTAGIAESIEAKLACMIDTLKNNCQAGLTMEESLKKYGYGSSADLSKIIETLKGPADSKLYIPLSQAALSASDLATLLPTQADFWAYYYTNYIKNYCATNP